MIDLSTLAAFASLGILSIPHCILMCGPLAARACSARSGGAKREGLAYLAGRTTSYVFLGATAGTVGAGLMSEAGRNASIVLVELAALVLFLQGMHRLFPRTIFFTPAIGSGGVLERMFSMLPTGGLPLGLATGFLPCGALAAALALAVAAGNPILGGAGMGVFALAGAPVLVLPLLLAARRNGGGPIAAISLSRWAGAAMIVLAVGIAVRPFTDSLGSPARTHCNTASASELPQ